MICFRMWPLPLLGIVLLVGCSGSSAEKPVKVKGVVTLDQKPLAEGEIIFRTAGAAPFLIPIKAGNFEGESLPGKKIVEIRAYKPGPPIAPMPGVPDAPGQVNYLPARYNDESKLEAEVTPKGPNEFKFEVTSK
jgi:hypothetical protein